MRMGVRFTRLSYSPIKYVIIPYITVVQTPSQSALLPASQALDHAPSNCCNPVEFRRATIGRSGCSKRWC